MIAKAKFVPRLVREKQEKLKRLRIQEAWKSLKWEDCVDSTIIVRWNENIHVQIDTSESYYQLINSVTDELVEAWNDDAAGEIIAKWNDELRGQ